MKGNIPVLMAQGKTLPEVWEQSVLLVGEWGIDIATEYDRFGDPLSKDCSMVMVVREPLAEPRIHRSFPADLETLWIYTQEVVHGVHDHYVQEHGWPYTYHRRLTDYPPGINQLDLLVAKLVEAAHTRRAQAITWIPEVDAQHHEPPCLQRLWCRLVSIEDGAFVLNMGTHWRSRDAFHAAFMNMFALTDLQHWIAGQVARLRSEEVLVGRYMDISDSYHIYGKDWQDFEKFRTLVRSRSLGDRTWTTKFAQPFFERARQMLQAETQ